ncbi:MAG TPA: transglycosylase family protein [Longimicrobiales bacterium]
MKIRLRNALSRPVAIGTAAVAVLAAAAALPLSSSADQSLGQLNSELAAQQAHQDQLSHSIGGLSDSVASLGSQIALVQSREAAVRADLANDRAALASVDASLRIARARLVVVRAALSRDRSALADQLVSAYENGNPDLVSVVIDSHGFTDLLERVTYLRDAEHRQQQTITITRLAKERATAIALKLERLRARDQSLAVSAEVRARALAGMNALLSAKQAALARALAAQRAQLAASQNASSSIRAKIAQIQAAQAAAAAAAAAAQRAAASTSFSSAGPAIGPSGGWAIPYPIVLCESGGQNLPPNSAGASGYYQILPATWKLYGGSGPAAYLASKGEQDAVASRIWNGGAGASSWVCAGIVGIH